MKSWIKSVPFLRVVSKALVRYTVVPFRAFHGSESYWRERYAKGGNSGSGSYDELAQFKADVLNAFVREHAVESVLEYGCGDGNQLKLAEYPRYHGFDVSEVAVDLCRQIFADDDSKTFTLARDYTGERADLTLSLDVIYHLVEDTVFDAYMQRLFDSSDRLVGIYSSNSATQEPFLAPHVRLRRFTDWIAANRPDWHLLRQVVNPVDCNEYELESSRPDFYFYGRATAAR